MVAGNSGRARQASLMTAPKIAIPTASSKPRRTVSRRRRLSSTSVKSCLVTNSLMTRRGPSGELDDCAQDRGARGQQHAKPDRQPETQVVEFSDHVGERGLQIGLGHKRGHDELPGSLGVSLGLLLYHATLPQIARVRKSIECEG